METTRQQKIAKLLQKDLAEIFRMHIADFTGHYAMVSVTKVYVTKDLSLARVYLSIFGTADKEAELKLIRSKTKHIRKFLGERIRHQLRVVPELHFEMDDSLDYIDRIDDLLKND